MAQETQEILPLFLQTDVAIDKIQPNEAVYSRGISFDQNGNPSENSGKGEGQNSLVLTPVRSNQRLASLPPVPVPAGYNKCCGSFESTTTQELYYCNFNGNGNHGIYVIGGNDGSWDTVVVDPELGFTDDQEGFITDHRAMLRTINDRDGNILEKFLLLTDGKSWHKWVNVIAAVQTKGFDASLFPYWTLQPPHFDRRELLEWAVRPIMQNPVAVAIANTPADANKTNNLVDRAFRFALVPNLTDGRYGTLSPYSLPVIIKTEDFLNDPDNISKNILVTLYAGSCMVESIDLYVQQTAKQVAGQSSQITWGPWLKYIRLYKYSGCGPNSPSVVGTDYWLRGNPWANNGYDPIQNTIQYVFDNSVLADIPSIDTAQIQTFMPQMSVALAPLGDAASLADNRYDYDNLPCATMDNVGAVVAEKANVLCPVPIRKVILYSYIGRANDDFTYLSQVGYLDGTSDPTTYFGSMSFTPQSTILFDVKQSKYFLLNFADRNGPVCYLKGTPFFSVGVLYQVDIDNNLTIAQKDLDFTNQDTLTYMANVFIAGGFFVYKFDFEVPAGRYDAAMGRHNVASTADYRGTSTYVVGIADSTLRTVNVLASGNIAFASLHPNGLFGAKNSIVTYSKEMEVDCTAGDVDVWGNGKDTFYIYCPYPTAAGNKKYRFIEGYLQESSASPLPVELFSYQLTPRQPFLVENFPDDWGHYTDKNGFYFAYTKEANSDSEDILFVAKVNCAYPTQFIVRTSGLGVGWKQNPPAYLADHNGAGACNRIVVSGKITNLDGTLPYSNIAISMVDGSTAYTRSDGTFSLIVHNGLASLRQSNIYVNASGNYLITILNCGQIPLFYFDETIVPCVNCDERIYPVPINLAINIQGGTQYSLKENATYSIGIAGADLAGRLWYVNVAKNLAVPSFLTRGDVLATYFQMLFSGALNLPDDMAWFAPYASNQLNYLRYVQWVGDSIKYIDNAGNVVADPTTAVFVSIAIDSFYNYNVAKNFSLLATYQFVAGDRIRILDDGNGNLLTTSVYGSAIDLQVLGTNYAQAAMAADLIPNTNTSPTINNNFTNTTNVTATGTPTVTSVQTLQNNTSITLYVRYDSRLDKLKGATGFWIEIYAPSQQDQQLLFNELTWYPVIKNEVAIFNGYSNGKPDYSFPTEIDLPYWDTYLFARSIAIPNVGDKFLNHPFESPNISDDFGYRVVSGGRIWEKNDDAKQLWYGADVTRSDNLTTIGIINGLGSFKLGQRKDFSQYPWGRIVAMISERGYVFFLCENDYFSTDYNFHYSYANEQGVMVTNLDQGLSTPHQKLGSKFGCAFADTGSVVIFDGCISWYDSKNMAWVLSDFRSAADITFFDPHKGVTGGMDAYLNTKTRFIANWNNTHDDSDRFDVVCGVDLERENLYLTFRPRRNNTNNISSYINNRRAVDYSHQETLVYSTITKRFTRFDSFAPEAYGKLRGANIGTQLVTFAAGVPYMHNTNVNGYMNFYGVQCVPVVQGVFNNGEGLEKIFGNLSLNISGVGMFVDLVRTNRPNSFSYIPINLFDKKQNNYFAAFLRDLYSFFAPTDDNINRSTLQDGKTISGHWVTVRLVGDKNNAGKYFELKNIYSLIADSTINKK